MSGVETFRHVSTVQARNAYHNLHCRVPSTRGRYSTDVWVGRCGWDAQTLTLFKTAVSDFPTLFKTEIFDFPTLFKTASRFLRPRLNTFNQKSLSSFVVMQASGIRANQKGTNLAFCTIFTSISVHTSCLNVRIPCLRQKVMKSIPRLIQKTLKTVLYLATCPL